MADKINSLSVVIPAYNEEAGIKAVIDDIRETLNNAGIEYEIIVVDDCSGDKTSALAAQSGVTVITHPVNAGYGQSLMTGFSRAKYPYIAMIDADGSYPARELVKLSGYGGDFDMLVGARHGANYWGNIIKHPARLAFLWFAEFVTGQSIPDANSGLRILKKESLPAGPLLCRGFSFSTTLTMIFFSTGKFVKFVPIEYLSRKGSSKVKIVRDTLRAAQVLVETIIFFNPLKLALPLSALPFLASLALLGRYFLASGREGSGLLGWALISFNFSLVIFMIGALMDLIRLKENNKY